MVGLKKIAPGRSKNVNEPAQLKYWRRGLHIPPDQSRRAVEKVGNSATGVRKELEIAAPQMKAGPARGMPAVVGAEPARCRKLYEQELCPSVSASAGFATTIPTTLGTTN
jgi:hypothetical protein